MKKQMCLMVATLLLLSGCTQAIEENPIPETSSPVVESSSESPTKEPSSEPQTQEEMEALRNKIMIEEGDIFGGLSVTQMEEDMDYLWGLLQNAYPFLGVARRAGIDPDKLYEKYRAEIPNIQSDIIFHNHLRDFVAEFQGIGHFGYAFNYDGSRGSYTWYHDNYSDSQLKQAPYLLERINNPATVQSYESLKELNQKIIAAVYPDGIPQQNQSQQEDAHTVSNVTTEIIEPGETAYVKINSFELQHKDADHEVLLAFFKEAAGCKNLIIDITGNGGGYDYYWIENIVGPIISETASMASYLLYRDDPEIQEYLSFFYPQDSFHPIDALPTLDRMNMEDKATMDGYVVDTVTINPTGERLFSGKVWLLVDDGVYSSTETFSMFCKSSGFATVVGTATDGDGAGIDPLIYTLPNSGALLLFSAFYSTNPDGSNSEEYGTTPDIISENGEIPLDTCLKAIQAENQ